KVRILHGEVLDAEGNFYRDNYRGAKAELQYVCRDGKQTWHPQLTFFGFRYLKLEEFPGEAKPEQFTAIAVYSDLRQTGRLRCGVPELNQLISNIFWGQRGNFLDVPTDCPQRDERLGWTGDAEVFVKTASYNFDVEKFFTKWLHDLAADQFESGAVGHVVPDYLQNPEPSAAWGDAATICPWQIYQTYGNRKVLEDQFKSMKKWVDYITHATTTPDLWTGGTHYGDWLGLDAPSGSYKGSSNEDLIASAFYAWSTELVSRAGRVLGEDVSEYETLHREIVKAFRAAYPVYRTQTEYTVAVWFELAEHPQQAADELAELVKKDGCRLKTGFVGTPFLLHVLSRYGHEDLAYTLLLRREYPSWLYPVTKGATTIWEHWDGIMEDGGFWSADMNSFNHYAYGSVADWIYEEAAGIRPLEPGFARVQVAPKPDHRLGWLEASIETRNGAVRSRWEYRENQVRYEIEAEMPATVVIDGIEHQVPAGNYIFWGKEK
ncbi:MAG TPA: family 78 glycoside hydrolase catalytic domain, partial [Candidatus Fusicatenibacter merdavium]|nr:family 78 glycoside hydrolase catalytic domain [Candidatus Fusicatenibacter merdavium]